MDKYHFYLSESREDYIKIAKNLGAYNKSQVGYRDMARLNILVKGEKAEPIGGVLGHTYWDWGYVEILWVAENSRNLGLGKNLMSRFEAEAMKRNCYHFHLETFDFQALEFYQALGYESFGKLEGFAKNRTLFFLKKTIKR